MKNNRFYDSYLLIYLLIITAFFFFSQPAEAEREFGNIRTSGHVEGFFYPPHNEYDPNPGIPFEDRVVARYGLDIQAGVSHKTFLPKLFLFTHSFAAFGDSRPQIDYNYEADPIVLNLKYGAGYTVFNNVQFRITHSRHIDLGGYSGERLLWNGVSVRYEW